MTLSGPPSSPSPAAGYVKWLVLLAIGVGSFMSALDGSIANIVLPIVSAEFRVNPATIEWVITVYLLVVSGLLLSFGRLGDLRGHKSVYVWGFGIFVAGSALCGLAGHTLALVASRALQGLGAAMILSNAPAILTGNFPPTQRGQALGLQSTMTYLGLTVGPSLGGWLAKQYTWRAVFYINVPVGLLALALSLIFIPRDKPDKAEPFDLAGAFTFVCGLVALLLALNQGSEWGWGSPSILGLIALAAVFLGVFVAIERRAPNPMLDLSLFGRRVFSASVVSAIFNYVCLYGILFLMPFYLMRGRGLDSAAAGLILTAQPLVMAVAAPISGTLSDRIGSRLLATIGMAVLGLGMFWLSQLGPETPTAAVAGALAVCGLGTGVFISPNSNALMGAAPRNRQGIASGIMATARNVGMLLGIGLAGAVFTTVMARAQAAGLPDAVFPGISAAFLAAAVVAGLGVITSAIRGKS